MSLQVNDAVIWQESAEGIALYHTETGAFLTLNQTGARIWKLVDSDGDRERIIGRLSAEYARGNGALSGRIRSEVEQFIAGMIEGGLLAEDEPAARATRP